MLEVIFGSVFEMKEFRWFFLEFWNLYLFFATEEFRRSCVGFEEFLECPLKNNSPAMDTCTWSYVDDLISCSHNIFVMFDNYDRISEIDEFSQIINKETTISWMKPD